MSTLVNIKNINTTPLCEVLETAKDVLTKRGLYKDVLGVIYSFFCPYRDGVTETERVLRGHTHCVNSVAKISDSIVVSGSFDKTLRVWNLEKEAGKECIKVLEGHTSDVWSVAKISESLVVSGSYDNTLRVWNLENEAGKECIKVLEGHTNAVWSVAKISESLVVSGSRDNTLRVWRAVVPQAKVCVCVCVVSFFSSIPPHKTSCVYLVTTSTISAKSFDARQK